VPAKKAPKKAAGKSGSAKKAAKASAKKPAAKKKAPEKASSKKAASKKTAVKKKPATTHARKSGAKKSPTRKTATAKAASKKKAPKKAAPKKAAAKKPAAKKKAPQKVASKKVASKQVAPKKAAPKKAAPKANGPAAASSELDRVSCQLASLALAQEDSPLSVRQREQLRRALATAGQELGWIASPSGNGDSVKKFSGDLIAMARNGAKSLGVDLAEQLVQKKTEIAQLNTVIAYARELAEDPATVYPADITFTHTVRDAYQSYVTKTETRVANDADEARSTAATVERSLTSWSKLAEAMIVDLKKRQRQLDHVGDALPGFVESSHDLLGEVVANLA
jgi:hypothetical protein